jgi:DNA-binding MarR family transcriptional regulator
MPDDQLTPEQQKAIQKILKRYREEADAILADHRAKIRGILEDLDKKKAEELAKLIRG